VSALRKNDYSLADTLIPVRMLNELVYCPRLFYYEYVQKEFTESPDTLDGHFVHRRVDQEQKGCQQIDEIDVRTFKSMYLSAPRLHLTTKIDLVEEAGGNAVPVEYKRGEAPKPPDDAWDSDKVQVCAQGLVLRENGYHCTRGEIYYAASKRRVTIDITNELVKRTLAVIDEALSLSHSSTLPPPLVDSPKCPRCSLVGICLPDETNLLASHSPTNGGVRVRRMFPARSDALPVYVQEQGSKVGRSGDSLTLSSPSGKKERLRLVDISQVCLFGNVHLTPSALRLLVENSIPICYLTYGGWFYAITLGHPHKNVELRIAQYESAGDHTKALRLASKFVEGKIRNMRTMLRRNHPNPTSNALTRLSGIARLSETVANMESLLGFEGTATELYFSNFQGMLKGLPKEEFHFSERNRRPPLDPVNALLSFTYALLVKDCFSSIVSVGLDPYLGFLHRPRYGRPALALDLMEEFRPIIGDSVVISLINNRELGDNDFVQHGEAVALNQRGRRKVIEAYHRRLDTSVTHPLFEYRLSYTRVLEVQSRLLCRALTGEVPDYMPFVTR
jgi:CRISPR-associated protein Cas1